MTSLTSKHWPWIITAFLSLLVWLQTCRYQKAVDEINQKEQVITQQELDKQTLHTIVNKQKKTITEQNVLTTTSQKAINDLTDTIFNLKKKDAKNTQTIAYYKAVTKLRIDSFDIPYLDTLAMKRFSDSVEAQCQEVLTFMRDSTIVVPKDVVMDDPNFSLSASIGKQSLLINALVIPDTLQLRFVEHKHGWFKPKTVEVQWFHSNPLIQTTSANSAIYRPVKKSFFKRVILPVAIGVGAGLIIAK